MQTCEHLKVVCKLARLQVIFCSLPAVVGQFAFQVRKRVCNFCLQCEATLFYKILLITSFTYFTEFLPDKETYPGYYRNRHDFFRPVKATD